MALGGVAASTGGVGDASRQDIRFQVDKKRAQDLLRSKGLLPPLPQTVTANGEIDAIRSAVAQGEGFTRPVNFVIEFQAPAGLDPFRETINPGGLDAQSHILNRSDAVHGRDNNEFWASVKNAGTSSWKQRKPDLGELGKPKTYDPRPRAVKKIDIYCSKVSIPDRSIPQGLYRHYGSSFAYPNSAMTYGTLTTTFYCDATMIIKKFFDAWQHLIYNPMTGNFNYYDEYTSKFDIFTRSTIKAAQKAGMTSANPTQKGWVADLQGAIQGATDAVNEFFGTDKNIENRAEGQGKIPALEFSKTYGCRIFECWPQVVGGIELSHDGGDAVSTFDVTWAYHKWSPFKMNGISERTDINLNIGEMRNEKDGIPFLEDLPPELAGPIGGAAQQAFNTSPAAKGSNIFG